MAADWLVGFRTGWTAELSDLLVETGRPGSPGSKEDVMHAETQNLIKSFLFYVEQ